MDLKAKDSDWSLDPDIYKLRPWASPFTCLSGRLGVENCGNVSIHGETNARSRYFSQVCADSSWC